MDIKNVIFIKMDWITLFIQMDGFMLIAIGIVALVIILNVLVFFLNSFIYPKINPSSNIVINSGTSHNGNNGHNGFDGINGIEANNGSNGQNGKSGLSGRPGKVGITGAIGNNGSQGDTGILGTQGVVGAKGLPSNSEISVINRYDMTNTDSYSMHDTFSFEDVQYKVSLYANIENNSRFVLKFGEDIIVPQAGFLTNLPAGSLPTTTLDGGTFYSNLRIAIGYGRGKMESKTRSDDTIFYISPPISRRSFLFRYRLPTVIPVDYEYLSVKFPIKPLNNTKDFYFYDSKVLDNISLDNELTLWKYHLFKGLGKYELVVNTFPPLPGNYDFNFRIIEEFTRNDSSDFALPKIVFPFNASVINFAQNGQTKLCVSNRFDINRVISRDYNSDKIAWTQTDKKTVEIVTGEKEPLIPYDNTFENLRNDDNISRLILINSSYYEEGTGVPTLQFDGYALPLRGTFNQDVIKSDLEVFFGMRNYVPKVPLDKFKNSEKLYLKIMFTPNFLTNTNLNEVAFIYGEEFSFDLIDFQAVYSKSIFLSKNNLVTFNSNGYIINFEPFIPQIFGPGREYLSINHSHGIEVGYTKYETKERYTTTVLPQIPISPYDYCFYFNIPLYGYKKR